MFWIFLLYMGRIVCKKQRKPRKRGGFSEVIGEEGMNGLWKKKRCFARKPFAVLTKRAPLFIMDIRVSFGARRMKSTLKTRRNNIWSLFF